MDIQHPDTMRHDGGSGGGYGIRYIMEFAVIENTSRTGFPATVQKIEAACVNGFKPHFEGARIVLKETRQPGRVFKR